MLILERICNLLFLIRDQLRVVFREHEKHSGCRGCHEAYCQSQTAAVGNDERLSLHMQAQQLMTQMKDGWDVPTALTAVTIQQ